MAKIIYQSSDGEQHQVEVSSGSTVMEGAVYNGIEGIVAECGGSCACATCHVYVDETFLSQTGELGEYEAEMLEETTSSRKDNSRLSCQIRVTDELDGMIVHMPESQWGLRVTIKDVSHSANPSKRVGIVVQFIHVLGISSGVSSVSSCVEFYKLNTTEPYDEFLRRWYEVWTKVQMI